MRQKEKIVIFIDELDRCRPKFALDLIEKVKHIFEVPNISFIFFANFEQMESMVKREYGDDIDAENYLNKFFPLSIKLPESFTDDRGKDHCNAFDLFIEEIGKTRGEEVKSFFIEGDILHDLFRLLFEKDSLSLRDAEKLSGSIFAYHNIVPCKQGSLKKRNTALKSLWLFSIYIHIFNKEFCTKKF